MAGPVTAVYWIRRAAALAGNEKTGNAVGTILTAFLLPFILIIVCLCGMMDAAADHNRAAVERLMQYMELCCIPIISGGKMFRSQNS